MIRLRIVRSCLDLGSTPLYENQHTNLFDSVVGGGLGGFVFCYGVKRRGRPLRGGWSNFESIGRNTNMLKSDRHRTSAPAPAPGNNGTGRQKKRGLKD